MKQEVDINPDMLAWAISRAGFEINEIANRFPMVLKWIKKDKKPTVKQLENFARHVHVPFGYLFFPEPPHEASPVPFFRTNRPPTNQVSLSVLDTIAIVQDRQSWLKDYLIEEEDATPLPFVGKFSNETSALPIVKDIRNTLGLSDEWARNFPNYEQSLEHLTQQIEDVGILIFFNGVVGNNTHRPIPVDECRGFVLVDPIVPCMFVNSADAKAAQFFTIVHELAHIWTGRSAGFDIQSLQPSHDPAEILCDQVAAEFLVPQESFNRLWSETPDINILARVFKVSRIVIARRALDLKHITKQKFLSIYNSYIAEFKRKKANQERGGDFYATAKKRISLTFAGYVNRAVKSDKLLYRDAYQLTGLRGDTFDKFFSEHFL